MNPPFDPPPLVHAATRVVGGQSGSKSRSAVDFVESAQPSNRHSAAIKRSWFTSRRL